MQKFQLFIILILFAISTMYAQTDSLIFNNSKNVVGEIKNLKLGVITVKTDFSDDDFKIEWKKVKGIFSDRIYIITLSDGERVTGKINSDPSDQAKVKIITNHSKEISAMLEDVVNIKPLDSGFWDQLSASIDLGYTFTKANNVKQFTLRSNLGYLTEHWNADFSLDAVRNSQDSVESTQRTDTKFGYSYFIGKNWFLTISANFLQNDEQKLKLRSTPKVGIGNFLVQTNYVYLSLSGGAAWNNEVYTDPTIKNRSSAEAYLGVEYNMFDFGDLGLLTNIFAYKSLDNTSRFRTDFKFDIKYDLPYDFYVKLGYTLNYDSKPVEGASQSDYVLQTTFGWSL